MLKLFRDLSGGLWGSAAEPIGTQKTGMTKKERRTAKKSLGLNDDDAHNDDHSDGRLGLRESKGEISDVEENDVVLVSDEQSDDNGVEEDFADECDEGEWEDLTFNVREDALEEWCFAQAADFLGDYDDFPLSVSNAKRGSSFVRSTKKNSEPKRRRPREHHFKIKRREQKLATVLENVELRKANVEREVGVLRPGVRRPAPSAITPSDARQAALEAEERAREREEEMILEQVIAESRANAQIAESPAEQGLTEALMRELMTRELTPEDYELLLGLDAAVECKHLSEADLAEFNTRIHAASDCADGDAVDCRVCLCEFEDEEEKMTLPCGHEFHKVCVTQWLTTQSTQCPIDNLEVR
jgi:Ring finger domain